jgi:hypothetical protein
MREHLQHGPAELRLVRCGTFDQPLPPSGQLILALPTRAPEETRPPCRDPPDREHVSRRFGMARVRQQLGRHELRGPEALERLGHPLPGPKGLAYEPPVRHDPAVRVDEDVRRAQIAVDIAMLVGVGDGLGDGEQAYAQTSPFVAGNGPRSSRLPCALLIEYQPFSASWRMIFSTLG